MTERKRAVPLPLRSASSHSDQEKWILVDKAPLEGRLAEIAERCRLELEAPSHSTTLFGFALEVLAMADADVDTVTPLTFRGSVPEPYGLEDEAKTRIRYCERCRCGAVPPEVTVCDACVLADVLASPSERATESMSPSRVDPSDPRRANAAREPSNGATVITYSMSVIDERLP